MTPRLAAGIAACAWLSASPGAWIGASAWLGAGAWLGVAAAQNTETPADAARDLTLPPTIVELPGDVRLEPAPAEREDVLEAVVTEGQTDFRLPDLGSSLRQQREAEAAQSDGRIEVGFLRLYDPEENDANEEFLSPDPEVLRGVGMLKVIELRIGGRDAD